MKKKHAGFTLIEILATVTIIGILFTMGIVSYINFNRKQMVSQSAKNIVNALRQVQSNATRGVKDPLICGSTAASALTLEAWYFTMTSNSYTIYGLCSGSSTRFFEQTVTLPASSPLSYSLNPVSPTTAGPIKFYPLANGTSGNYTICVGGFGDSSNNYKITVANMGEINEKGFYTCP